MTAEKYSEIYSRWHHAYDGVKNASKQLLDDMSDLLDAVYEYQERERLTVTQTGLLGAETTVYYGGFKPLPNR